MANFLKKVTKGIENAMDLNELDEIVEKLDKEHERAINGASLEGVHSLSDLKDLEERIRDEYLEKYDHKAEKETKKKVSPDWREGSKQM